MPRLLDNINSPKDVKSLSSDEALQLAGEVRDELVMRTAINGGHLASSLGVVELTVALHRVFDSPKDKIIWDVGHQAYTHKLLTGRNKNFDTLRKYNGLSGFPSREESPHDPFGAGHASTSVSAALGIATARDLKNEDFNVIAVIGDGSITGGMAFEAFNNASRVNGKLIVILNDNGMSIAPTVGALDKLLSKVRFDYKYYRASERSKRLLSRYNIGRKIWELGQKVKNSVKGFLMPTVLWEEFGFAYMGPINGHNITEVEKALEKAKSYTHKPVLLHVMTTKGKGYGPAEEDAVCFHGISPKKAVKCTPPALTQSYSKAFGECIIDLLEKDPKAVVITAAMPDGYCLCEALEKYPKRVFDVGISEQHAVTFAAGMAVEGYKPIIAIYSTFLQRAYDQIVHDVCLQNLPVIFAIDRGGIVGEDGKTHQGIFDLSYLSSIPNMVIAAPKDSAELKSMLHTALGSGKIVAIRYPRGNSPEVKPDAPVEKITIGKGELLRDGNDAAVLAIGATVAPALEAADILKEKGINISVINARYCKPLDEELILKTAKKTKVIVTAEENVASGGFGSLVNALLNDKSSENVTIKNLTVDDEFVEHGAQAILREKYKLDAKGIADTISSMLSGNGIKGAHKNILPKKVSSKINN